MALMRTTDMGAPVLGTGWEKSLLHSATVKAAVQHRYGPPDVVHIEDLPRPVPGDGELLVAVGATTVNRTDCGFRAAKPFIVRPFSGLVRPRAKTLGNEFAGTVAAVGPRVTRFAEGDRVFGYCEGRFGAHAEYMVIGETASVAPTPVGVAHDRAAPICEGAHYALSYIRAAGIGSGTRVLVNGATGGIGSAAVQLVKGLGAQVTAVCTTDHIDLISGLGADRVVDRLVEDFTSLDDRFDVVFDAVGKSTFAACREVLTDRGVYLSTELGPWSQNPALALTTRLGRGQRVMFPIPKDDQSIVEHLGRLVEAGDFRPVIDRVYPLDDIADAYRYVETGEKIGNVVIDVRA